MSTPSEELPCTEAGEPESVMTLVVNSVRDVSPHIDRLLDLGADQKDEMRMIEKMVELALLCNAVNGSGKRITFLMRGNWTAVNRSSSSTQLKVWLHLTIGRCDTHSNALKHKDLVYKLMVTTGVVPI